MSLTLDFRINNVDSDKGRKRIILDRKLIPRPVVEADDVTTYQKAEMNDIVIERNRDTNTFSVYAFMGYGGLVKFGKLTEAKSYVFKMNKGVLAEWFTDDSIFLPAGFGWDGVHGDLDTYSAFNLDLFFKEWDLDSIKESIEKSHTTKKTVSSKGCVGDIPADLIELNIGNKPVIKKGINEYHVNKIIGEMPDEYVDWIMNNSVCEYTDISQCDWRKAQWTRRVMYINLLWLDNDPAMATELIAIDEDGNYELFSMMNFIEKFRTVDSNLLSFPVVIPVNTVRLIMVKHNLVANYSTWYLFKTKKW